MLSLEIVGAKEWAEASGQGTLPTVVNKVASGKWQPLFSNGHTVENSQRQRLQF
jgi:hypothetical protein